MVFEECMNAPECPVRVGGVYYNTYTMDENPYTVLEVFHNGDYKYYAKCSHVDEFSGENCIVDVFAWYLAEKPV